MRALFMAVCAALLFTGMSRLYAESPAPGDDTYVLHVEQVECDKSHVQMQDVATNLPPAVNMIARDEMVAFPDAIAVKFPDLELVLGQQREIDQQKSFKYPSAFDAAGNPTEFSARGVGMKISATISGITNCIIPNKSTGVNRTNTCVSLRYFFENVTGPLSTNEVEKIRTADPQLKDTKGPCFHSRNMSGDILLPLGWWMDLGGAVEQNRYMTSFLKVEKK